MSAAMFILDKCCFCIELRPSCFLIAYVQLLIEGLTFVMVLNETVEHASLMTSNIELFNELAFIMLLATVVFLAFLILMFIFTIALIIGLHKRSRCYIKAYLIFAIIFLLLYVTTAFVSYPMVEKTALDIVYKVVSLVMYVYFGVIIRSYWNQMALNSRDVYRYTNANS